MNRILVLDIKDLPDDLSLFQLDLIVRKYVEETWRAKLDFIGNYPDRDTLKESWLINSK